MWGFKIKITHLQWGFGLYCVLRGVLIWLKLFIKEKGISINEFITHSKITTAENLLKFSDFTSLEIAMALGYSSQSAFISVFKKFNGVTPKQYRDMYYMSNISYDESQKGK